ncbi:hypothetical protein THAOC_13062, partial [Thalassiosira oceanica]
SFVSNLRYKATEDEVTMVQFYLTGKRLFPNKWKGMKLRSGRRVGPPDVDNRRSGRVSRGGANAADIANPAAVNIVDAVPLQPDNVPSNNDEDTVSAEEPPLQPDNVTSMVDTDCE